MSDRFDTFTDGAKRALVRAQTEALRRRHTHIGPEHLLLGLTGSDAGTAARILTALGVDRHHVRRAVAGALDRSQVRVSGALRLTPRAKRVIALAVAEADRLRDRHIGPEHLLLGLVAAGEGVVAGVLTRLGVELEPARAAVRRRRAGSGL